MKSVDVCKFGGAAVGSAEAVRIAAAHVECGRLARTDRASRPIVSTDGRDGRRVRAGRPHSLVVIVSAMSGITDLLHGAARAALCGEDFAPAADEFENRHATLARDILKKPQRMLDEIRA